MLSITLHDNSQAFRFQLEGELVESVVAELEGSWRTAASTFSGRPCIVDFSNVTHVDEAGWALLRRMRQDGAQLVAEVPRSSEPGVLYRLISLMVR